MVSALAQACNGGLGRSLLKLKTILLLDTRQTLFFSV